MLNFEDISILPEYSEINSRRDVDISSKFLGIEVSVPIVASPMSSVTEAYMCNSIYNKGGIGIIHRYNTIQFQKKLLNYLDENVPKIASTGIGEDAYKRLDILAESGLQILSIDTSFSFSNKFNMFVKHVKINYPHLKIIGSNCSSIDCLKFFIDIGIDAARIGFFNGSCSLNTVGFKNTSLQILHDIKKERIDTNNISLIADGGHRNTSDIVKSFALGADFVMLGNMLSGVKESSSKYIVEENGKRYKKVIGNGSKLNQTIYRGSYGNIEGKDIQVKSGETLQKIIYDITSSLKSALSYAGCNNLEEFKLKSKILINGEKYDKNR